MARRSDAAPIKKQRRPHRLQQATTSRQQADNKTPRPAGPAPRLTPHRVGGGAAHQPGEGGSKSLQDTTGKAERQKEARFSDFKPRFWKRQNKRDPFQVSFCIFPEKSVIKTKNPLTKYRLSGFVCGRISTPSGDLSEPGGVLSTVSMSNGISTSLLPAAE